MNWPRTLSGRLVLIMFSGLVVAQLLTVVWVFTERSQAMRGMMVAYLAADVASSVAMLDRLPPAERVGWLPRLQRANYRLSLPAGAASNDAMQASSQSPLAAQVTQALSQALPHTLPQTVQARDGTEPGVALQFGLRLQDGTPVVVDLDQPRLRISTWVVGVLMAQLALLAALCAAAVRQATQPLARLANAASALAPGRPATALPETGPHEVAQASRAFNRMRTRIDEHLSERTQMLAAISHDLQTPITRMRLRADLLDDTTLRDKLQADLVQMQHLVAQGLAYARSEHPVHEPAVPTDLVALLESIVADHQDAAQPVQWLGGPARTLHTRPAALRRAIANLIENAVKFAGAAELSLSMQDGRAVVRVMDRGPGIPADAMHKVVQPFYRIEGSRDPATGGTGLGLAIVHRLVRHCDADLVLAPRQGGGLVASIRLPTTLVETTP